MKGSRVLHPRTSYKAGGGDTRESPALTIMGAARRSEADVSYHDPYVPKVAEFGFASVGLEQALATADLAGDHHRPPAVDYAEVAATAPLTLDFRGVTRGIDAEGLELL